MILPNAIEASLQQKREKQLSPNLRLLAGVLIVGIYLLGYLP